MSRRSRLLACLFLVSTMPASCMPQGRRYVEPPPDSYVSKSFQLSTGDATETVRGAEVSAAFFPATQAPPLLGRSFHEEDFKPASTPVVMLHDDLWRRVFKGDPSIIGKQIQLDGRTFIVIGIMPRDFAFPAGGQIWIPRGR